MIYFLFTGSRRPFWNNRKKPFQNTLNQLGGAQQPRRYHCKAGNKQIMKKNMLEKFRADFRKVQREDARNEKDAFFNLFYTAISRVD